MKKSKIIIPALAMLAMSTAATVTGTVAWFSMNKTVTAEGMLVRAQGQGSIVITKYSTATGKGRPQTTDKTTGVDFADTGVDANGHSNNKLFPTTHSNDYTNHTHGLKYVNNGAIVSYETGLAKNNTTLTFSGVDTAQDYYKDYDIWIAGDGSAFQGAVVSASFGTLGTYANINQAVSVDFYAAVGTDACAISGGENGTFQGTLNIAGLNPETNNAAATKTAVTFSSFNIPKSGDNTNGALFVKMRVYFDGNLKDHQGTNDYTSYTKITEENKKVQNYWNASSQVGAHYFYNENGDIVMDNSDPDAIVTGLYIVDTTASSTTFARSVDYELLDNVALNVVFTVA